jgi:hypothetical protein
MHECGGLFIRWPAFIGRREFGRITMDQMTRRAFGVAGFALLATSATFAQQQSPTVRVRGTVEGVDGPMLTVKSRDGQTTYNVKMVDNVAVRGIVKASLSDIQQNSFIGAAGRRQPEGRGNPHFPRGLARHRRRIKKFPCRHEMG